MLTCTFDWFLLWKVGVMCVDEEAHEVNIKVMMWIVKICRCIRNRNSWKMFSSKKSKLVFYKTEHIIMLSLAGICFDSLLHYLKYHCIKQGKSTSTLSPQLVQTIACRRHKLCISSTWFVRILGRSFRCISSLPALGGVRSFLPFNSLWRKQARTSKTKC